jgi:phage tail-like protein
VRLLELKATALPDGNRIEVSWTRPPDPAFARVRVVRREGTHPTTPNPATASDGVVVGEMAGESPVLDVGLRGETTYYYSLYPYNDVDPASGQIVVADAAEQIDPANRVSALATSPYGMAEQMYDLLPAIYRRYDAAHGDAPLRRFLDLPAGQLDQLYSHASAMLHVLDLARVDGALLPLLAQWIGWNSDRRLEVGAQRNELRHAPAVYRTIGLIPVIEATVERVGGRPSRIKEFVHNVAATNRPARLNLWSLTRSGSTWEKAELLSLDGAFGGRPTVAGRRLFYEKEQGGRSGIWTKTLGAEGWGPSEPIFVSRWSHKAPSAAARGDETMLFWSAFNRSAREWSIQTRTLADDAWTPAATFIPPDSDDATQRRGPCAVSDGAGVWLFYWERTDSGWRLKYNRHDGRRWQMSTSPTVFEAGFAVDDLFALFHPSDGGQRLWLLWAREEPVPADQDPALPRQTRWSVAYRVKAGLDTTVNNDWGQIRTVTKVAPNTDHDREPCAVVMGDGNVELFLSSHRGGNWAIWRSVINRATHALAAPIEVPFGLSAVRAPLTFARGQQTTVVARSSESMRYRSGVFTTTETVDARYAGSSTYHAREPALRARRGTFDDAATYLYDTGRADGDLFARDTVGVYVPANTDAAQIARLGEVLPEFMPATDRAVFIKDGP